MDHLIDQFNNLKCENIISIFSGKIVATRFIPKDSKIGCISGKIKYFWEIYPEFSKSLTIDQDVVLEMTNFSNPLTNLEENFNSGNVILTYEQNYNTGTIDNFTIVSIIDIEIGDELIVKIK
jgi:uncharacterized protein YkvS